MFQRICAALLLSMLSAAAIAANAQWLAVPERSSLAFVATQAGAEFESQFKKFRATVEFDSKNAASFRVDVLIDLASVDSQDSERDSVIKGPELFWIQRYPEAHYVAESATRLADGRWRANGKLTLRSVTLEVPITFTFDEKSAQPRMTGSASLKRLAFGVGRGEWASTEWVADDVKVVFDLQLAATAEGALKSQAR